MTVADSRVGMAFGKYQITSLLGTGGMGEVYEAVDTDKGRTVALKILTGQNAQDERFRTRLVRESYAAAILQEPHVIPIHDWGEIDGNLYIDMRLVRGQTLHDLLKKGPLEPERAVAIIQQIAAALDAAHAEGLIHRDVKPQNIIITPADFAYLVDFGIAEAKGATRLTMAGTQVGSFAYMAPERFNDTAGTPAVDVYSLACVLYEALTGDTPFRADSFEHLIAAHISAPPPRPSTVNPRVPASFDDVIARGMAKDPDDRYGSAGALGRAAQRPLRTNGRAASETNTMAAPYAPWPQSGPATGPTVLPDQRGAEDRSRQWVLPVVIGVVAALLLGVIGVVIGLLASQDSGSTTGSSPTTTYAAPTTAYTVPEPTVYQTVPPSPSTQPVPDSSTARPVPDPDSASLRQLRQIAGADRPFVSAQLADRWVPQLSSKRPGVVDDGVVWDNARTLQEHLQLRQQYPGVRLLWSGDWSTFSATNFWVTTAGVSFPDSSGAVAWCRTQGFDRDHCFAKIVSTTHPIEGSTAYK